MSARRRMTAPLPRRIQLSRRKGWRKPPGTIVVARPTKWGNPWRVGDAIGPDMDCPARYRYTAAVITPHLAVELYRAALLGPSHPRVICGLPIDVDDIVRELGGHDLACWCPLDQPCHADLLLTIALGPL